MPITFLIDPQLHLVRTTYVGLITMVDLAMYARVLADRGLLKLAQLIDARQALLKLTAEEMRILSELMTTLRSKHGRAPVAFIAGNAPSYYLAESYQKFGAGGNPRFATFTDVASAETWLVLEEQ
jgi:hypothetical protein